MLLTNRLFVMDTWVAFATATAPPCLPTVLRTNVEFAITAYGALIATAPPYEVKSESQALLPTNVQFAIVTGTGVHKKIAPPLATAEIH